jgi:hypothetical protein
LGRCIFFLARVRMDGVAIAVPGVVRRRGTIAAAQTRSAGRVVGVVVDFLPQLRCRWHLRVPNIWQERLDLRHADRPHVACTTLSVFHKPPTPPKPSMLDTFEILTTSGVVLWSRTYVPVGAHVINSLIRDVFIEERIQPPSEDAGSKPTYRKEGYTLKWTAAKDLGLIFVVRVLQNCRKRGAS